MTGTDHLRCVVERTTYQSSETGFAVLQCRAKGYPELVTVVGNMPEVHSGSVLTLEGAWKMDARYGRQFTVIKFEEALPATVYGIEKYLGSGLIKGIGPKFAHLIRSLTGFFDREDLDNFEAEFYQNFANKGYVFVSCGLEIKAYIPYLQAQALDKQAGAFANMIDGAIDQLLKEMQSGK